VLGDIDLVEPPGLFTGCLVASAEDWVMFGYHQVALKLHWFFRMLERSCLKAMGGIL